MKLALIGDIHSNLPALEAVLSDLDSWQPDQVVMLGDLVNRGPQPIECYDLIKTYSSSPHWHLLAGNHEDYVSSVQRHPGTPGTPKFEWVQHTRWTANQLSKKVKELSELPDMISLNLAGINNSATFTHASLLGNRIGIYPDTSSLDLIKRIDVKSQIFGVGHTHRPLIREFGKTIVVNAGSVGLPFDGDRRSGYARLTCNDTCWRAEIHRVDYDWQAAWQAYNSEQFAIGSGPISKLLCLELELAVPLLATWTQKYQKLVLARELTIKSSISLFLRDL